MAKARSLQTILSHNKKNLQADFTTLAQLDEAFHDIAVSVGENDLDVSFERGTIEKNDFIFEGEITLPDHSREKLPLIKARAKKDAVELEFTQDIDLSGNPKIYTYKPSAEQSKEYTALRNGLFNELHSIILKEYTGKDSVKLVRKRFKQAP